MRSNHRRSCHRQPAAVAQPAAGRRQPREFAFLVLADDKRLQQSLRGNRRGQLVQRGIRARRLADVVLRGSSFERGDPGVSIANYATVLFVMGTVDRLADLVDPKNDPVGLQLEEENLPQRIRTARKQKLPKGKRWIGKPLFTWI